MEQIRQLETEIDNLKKQKRTLEEQEKALHSYDYEDGYYCRDERKSKQYLNEIADLEEKIKSRQQMVQTLTRNFNQSSNRNNQISSSSFQSNNQSQGEIQELKRIILRLERKVDNLQTQLNTLTNKQRQSQSTNQFQAQTQIPPKSQRRY